MFATAIIAFREYLEAFLIVGVFLGISAKLRLNKAWEISLAACAGVMLSLVFIVGTYILGNYAQRILTEKNADVLESYLLIFSGLFISYVTFSLHGLLHKGRGGVLLAAHKKLKERTFDISLFITIVFVVLREGFEVALFTSSVSLFSAFTQNVTGLVLGVCAAIAVGTVTTVTYIRLPIYAVWKWTEYAIVILGASLIQLGLTSLIASFTPLALSRIVPFHLTFLPSTDSLAGHMLQGFLGIDREFSLGRLSIMLLYILIIYMFMARRRRKVIRMDPR